MVERSPSTTSIGFGALPEPEVPVTPISNQLPYGQRVFNICGLAIKCIHNRMALFYVKDRTALWLPFVITNAGQKWETCIRAMEEMIVSDQIVDPKEKDLELTKVMITSTQMFSFRRLQLPNDEFVEQTIVCGYWTSSGKVLCCANTERFFWCAIEDIINKKNSQIWGGEVIDLARFLNKSDQEMKGSLIEICELTNDDTYQFLTYSLNSSNTTKRWIAESLHKTSVDRRTAQKLHSDFVQHCYPSLNMSYISYRQFLTHIRTNQLEDKLMDRAFIAFSFKSPGFISYKELLLGLVAIDPLSPDNDMRIAYIFYAYDHNLDGYLDRSDLMQMVTDIYAMRKQSVTYRDLEQHVNQMLTTEGFVDKDNRITLKSLTQTSSQPLFKDIRMLFRSEVSLIQAFAEKSIYQLIEKAVKKFDSGQYGSCPKHRVRDYRIATHKVMMNTTYRIIDSQDLRISDGKDIMFSSEPTSVEIQRRHSIDLVVRKNSDPNQTIASIRELGNILKSDDKSFQTLKEFQLITVQNLTIELIKTICEQTYLIFYNEKRVVKVQTPVYVLGDIHGNLRDLMTFEDQIWRTNPYVLASSLVFAGDYVDRGDYGIECVLYLFAMKILNPNQVFLLRGNHEIRSIQKQFTFEKECNDKYKTFGPQVFELINRVFDVMPIAAIVDESIYCAHGGIPYSMTRIEQLQTIPVQLTDPEIDSPAAWEVMWSDPMHKDDYIKYLSLVANSDPRGFAENMKRGTAYVFSDDAVNAFLASNQLSHIVRAHECFNEGYHLFFEGKLISIFSSSRYCNFSNKAAALFVDGEDEEGLIKIITLET